MADFGLALRDEDFGKQRNFAGTPAYMSPEQARQEGHLIDGRSDIFSLGVVMYELLTGVRPFQGEDLWEVLEKIKTDDPKPPRQRNDAIPKELERICLEALSKRATDRHTCAADFAVALRDWARVTVTIESRAGTIKIVPKGLRSFDAADSDFFLNQLEGPRDQRGLPDSLRFWKTHIEEIDPTKTFRVGLLYGPSGCGKSSLMKASLLPRLADHVVRVYVECTPDNTEKSLLAKLRQACGDLPRDASLIGTVEAIRRGKGLAAGRKLLMVSDQFEQWLHARTTAQADDLVNVLRQCDGQRLQALLLVRDEFYPAADRLAHCVEVSLRGGENQAILDLFDPPHARRPTPDAQHQTGTFHRQYGSPRKSRLTISYEDARPGPSKLAIGMRFGWYAGECC